MQKRPDKQSSVLEQLKSELALEASLERVRVVAMGMKEPADMLEICRSISKQLRLLKVRNIRNVQTAIFHESKGTYLNYEFFPLTDKTCITEIEYNLQPDVKAFVQQMLTDAEAFFTTAFRGAKLKQWIDYQRTANQFVDPHSCDVPSLHYYFFSIGPGALGISAYSPLHKEVLRVLKRFRNVFQLAYRRFMDIEKAFAQAREAQIEAALERVRSVAMSMNKPDDLLNTCEALFKEFHALGFGELRNTMINIHQDADRSFLNYDYSDEIGRSVTPLFYTIHPVIEKQIKQIRSAPDAFSETVFTGKELEDWKEFRRRSGEKDDPRIQNITALYYYFYSIGTGSIGISTFNPVTKDKLDLLKRFRNVFDFAYRRYMDVAQAEAHVRETRIELSLERVRARSMAMHSSAELVEASDVLFQQLQTLGIESIRTGVGIIDGLKETIEIWSRSHSEGQSGRKILGVVPKDSHPFWSAYFDAWIRKEKYFSYDCVGDEVERYYRAMSTLLSYPEVKAYHQREVFNMFFFPEGSLNVVRHAPLAEGELHLLQRFANVFGQMYRRFLDLQTAEAQAREAQIEAGMEKVRGRAMAMHSSNDLAATTAVIYTELRKLGIGSVRCGVVLLSNSSRKAQVYATSTSGGSDSLELIGSFEMSGHPSFESQYQCWLKQENYFTTISGEELRSRYELLRSSLSVPYLPREHGEHQEHGYFFSFSEGQFYVWTQERYSVEEIDILSRFKAIVELTFRRYLDLQKAEAQTRESQIEASLERVRSRTLAMQKSDELGETAAVLFRQLIALGIAPNRLYIAIINDDSGAAEFWITDEDGSKVSSGFAANLHDNSSFQKMFEGWQEGKRSLTIDMQGKELQEYFQHLSTLKVPFKGGLSQKRRVQNIAFFSKGFIGIASPNEQTDETTLLLERFAAVFNLTFTRFNDLKLAEAQTHQVHRDLIQLQAEKKRAEEALAELRTTQEQLVQQEKLASLGQLTAGIAHEIKNPLNFVNNFSSVSVELIDEVIEEIKRAAPDPATKEVPQLLTNIKANLSKIIEHGTRADSIVKSMLQHSRGGSSKMEPTDLNALIKEYVNLAFHGMRASKNPINVNIELDLDRAVGNVSLKAEDFSRVILNLSQNAFDAMRDKQNTADVGRHSGSYLPKLAVRTRREAQRVTIQIEDNGPGIPDTMKDKVMQPFFTTKKGTQGTGLGLSITNDIVKAHGGEMTIESNAGGGATFRIALPVEAKQ